MILLILILIILPHTSGYFKNLLGTPDSRIVSLDNSIWKELKEISQESRLALK
jgi:hypothetical protein